MKEITIEEAIQFLRDNRPMPPETEVSEDVMEKYIAVLRHMESHDAPECVPLVLDSFPDDVGDTGLGVYADVVHVLKKYPPPTVVPALRAGLESPRPGVRFWCAEIASAFPDESIVDPLIKLLSDEDRSIRFRAALALHGIARVSDVDKLRAAMSVETDDDTRDLISGVINAVGVT